MDLPTLSLVLIVVYAASIWVSARAFQREVERAARAKQPMPRLVAWWERVWRYAPWMAGIGVLLIAVGLLLVSWVALVGLALLGYVGQAWAMRAAARRGASAATR